jgi:outer membrane biosynthesis protein TonB
MNRFARVTLTVSALSLGLLLAGCESFDPTAIFDSELFNTKKKLPGDRRPVFPEGTPGVPQGVPQEYVKGYQAPAEPEPQQQATVEPAEKAKPKPKPKPKVVARPPDQSNPTPVTVRPSPSQAQSQPPAQTQWPDPPTQQRQPAAGQWPGTSQPSSGGGVAWPDPPSR